LGVLLERARQVFGSVPREMPLAEPFDVACACGQHVTGVRQDHRQFARCSQCGQFHLVLPISPYPKPISYEAPHGAVRAVVEEGRPKRSLGIRFRIRVRRINRASRAFFWAFVPPARWFSPVRLLMMAMILAVVGTISLTIYLGRRGGLTSDISSARVAWMADLEAGDFAKARVKLDAAAVSIKRYGKQGPEFREIEQLAKEVALLADFVEPSLEDVFREIEFMSLQQCSEYLRDKLRNPGMVLDVFVCPALADVSNIAGFRVDSKIFVGTKATRLDLSDFRLFQEFSPGLSTRVVFGARIQSIERIENSDEWIIRFVPDSGALITSPLCLEKFGWPMDELTKNILEAQNKWVVDQP